MTETQRYARQIKLWGQEKQQILERSTVLVAGVGGLGGTVSQLLVRAGVGQIYLVDNGEVDWPDLNRQTLFDQRDIGLAKVECAARYLRNINSRTAIVPLRQIIDSAFTPPDGIDLTADCLDNYTGRFHLEAALPAQCPFVHGAVEGDQGQILTLIKGQSQPLKKLLAGALQPAGDIPVSGASATTIAALMTQEIFQVLFGTPQLLNRFMIVSLTDLHFSFLDV